MVDRKAANPQPNMDIIYVAKLPTIHKVTPGYPPSHKNECTHHPPPLIDDHDHENVATKLDFLSMCRQSIECLLYLRLLLPFYYHTTHSPP